jgi:putative phosphoesterase
MKIGLISDTHGFIDPSVFRYFSEVDEIWHAGDIGNYSSIKQLLEFKPLIGVFGNIDGTEIRNSFNEDEIFEKEGLKVFLTHIAGPFEKYTPRIKNILEKHAPGVLICGHSHICKVAFDKKHNLLYINPGAAGNHGFHLVKTIIRFNIVNGKISNLEVIELGKRALSK